MPMDVVAAYGGLFLSALLAATLLPAQSEALLAGLVAADRYSVAALVVVATVGNTLGACINWVLGRGVVRFGDRPWFPLKPAARARAESWFQRFGWWSLLFSWLPIVGDPLTLVAGMLRVAFVPFLILVLVGKAARYALIAGLLGGFVT